MSIRTFWIILLKIIGVFFVFESIGVVTSLATVLFSRPSGEFVQADSPFSYNLLLYVPILILYFLALRLFLFKSTWFVDKLKLDKGFDEERLDFNFPKTSILSISVIVIGGIMFADYFPSLIKACFSFYQSKSIFREGPAAGNLIFQFVKTLIAFLLMSNYKGVVKFLMKSGSSETED